LTFCTYANFARPFPTQLSDLNHWSARGVGREFDLNTKTNDFFQESIMIAGASASAS
jgi:hypothetical protein